MLWVYIAITTGLGAIVGSFLNVVVLRLHAGKQFVSGRSACPHCKHELSPLELVPILSWLGLRGRCKHCRKPISAQYPLVEVLTAGLFGLSYYALQPHIVAEWVQLVAWLVVLAGFVVLAVYDLRWMILPDKVVAPLIMPILVLVGTSVYIASDLQPLIGSASAAILFGGFFYALAAVSKGAWMGGGDIKLVFVLGLLLGLKATTLGLLFAFWGAAIVAIILIVAGKKGRRDVLPFGPFLILGAIAAYLAGRGIIDWYMSISLLSA